MQLQPCTCHAHAHAAHAHATHAHATHAHAHAHVMHVPCTCHACARSRYRAARSSSSLAAIRRGTRGGSLAQAAPRPPRPGRRYVHDHDRGIAVASPHHDHDSTIPLPSPRHHHAITTPSPQHHHGRHRVVEAEVWPSAWAASLGEIPARSGICRPERWWWPRSCSISTTTTRRRSLQPANCIPMHPACSPLSPTATPHPPPATRHPRLTLVRCMTSGLKK